MSEVQTILGWDAAWTETGSGAWSVITLCECRPRVLMVERTPTRWDSLRDRLAEVMHKFRPELVTIDMPVGTSPVTGYREADRATTRAFSAYGCPVHSPTRQRPGDFGSQCVEELRLHGFHVSTRSPVMTCQVVEVYPHTALLYLLRRSYRYPYKISRAGSYWSQLNTEQGRGRVQINLNRLVGLLGEEMDLSGIHLAVPTDGSQAQWKALEDQVDALVCGWAGVKILEGHIIPYGDEQAAIWNPDLNKLDPPQKEA